MWREKNSDLREVGGHAVERLGGPLARCALLVQVGRVLLGDGGQFEAAEIPDDQLRRQIRAGQGVIEHRRQEAFGAHSFQRDQQIVVDGGAISPAFAQ